MCAATVASAVVAKVHGIELPDAVCAALLFVPLLVCRVLCHEPLALLTVVHALVAIHRTLRRRKQEGDQPTSALVRWAALLAIAATLVSLVY